MPSRKHIKPLPNFSFVPLEFNGQETNWRKIHSGTVRSHAAYWGGSARDQRPGKKQSPKHLRAAPAPTSVHIPGEDAKPMCGEEDQDSGCYHIPLSGKRLTLSRLRNSNPASLPCTTRPETLRHFEPNHLRYLLPLYPHTEMATPSFAVCLSTFEFCGDSFVKQFMLDNADHSIMFRSFLLLSYAHYMALTGLGTNSALLEYKGQVIRHISTRMSSSSDVLSPQYLTAIMTLGAPIVCLVSQDMPKRLSIWEYIIASMEKDYLCCVESADTAQSSLEERAIHRQAVRRLFTKSVDSAQFRDPDSLALFQYISNYMHLSRAIEGANYQITPIHDHDRLIPSPSPKTKCSILPEQWISPITWQQLDWTPALPIETQILLLCGFTQRWLATFLDQDNDELTPTEGLLRTRNILRESLEPFPAAAKSSIGEAEAMYECCRWASLILLYVEKYHVPIYVAAKHVRIYPRLIRRLRMTDLSKLWGPRKGLLLWVTAVCHFSVAGQCFPLLGTTILAKLTQEIAMEEHCDEIAVTPLTRLKVFESLCCRVEGTSWGCGP